MAKTIGNLLDEVSKHFADQGLTPVEIGVWVERDGGPWPVSMLDVNLQTNSLAFPYTTIDEDDVDDLFTMHDLYEQLRKISFAKESTKITAYDDSGDSEDQTEEGDPVFHPIKSFKFEDGQNNVKEAKVILVC